LTEGSGYVYLPEFLYLFLPFSFLSIYGLFLWSFIQELTLILSFYYLNKINESLIKYYFLMLPIFYIDFFNGNTNIFIAFLLIISYYLFIKDKYFLGGFFLSLALFKINIIIIFPLFLYKIFKLEKKFISFIEFFGVIILLSIFFNIQFLLYYPELLNVYLNKVHSLNSYISQIRIFTFFRFEHFNYLLCIITFYIISIKKIENYKNKILLGISIALLICFIIDYIYYIIKLS